MWGFRGWDHGVEVFDNALDLIVAQDAEQLPEADRERCVAWRLQAADQVDPRQRGRAWRVTARQGHPQAMALPLAGAKSRRLRVRNCEAPVPP